MSEAKKYSLIPIRKKIFATILVIFGLIALVNFGLTVYLLHERNELSSLYVSRFAYLVDQGITSENKPVVIDPTTNQAYLPDAKLVLPAIPENLGEVNYSYLPPGQGIPAEAQISDTASLNQIKSSVITATSIPGIINKVPKLAECSQGIIIQYQNIGKQNLAYAKKLSNGQTLYFYTQPQCADKNLLNYVEQINSY